MFKAPTSEAEILWTTFFITPKLKKTVQRVLHLTLDNILHFQAHRDENVKSKIKLTQKSLVGFITPTNVVYIFSCAVGDYITRWDIVHIDNSISLTHTSYGSGACNRMVLCTSY